MNNMLDVNDATITNVVIVASFTSSMLFIQCQVILKFNCITVLKVARSGFQVTIPFKFEQLLYNHKQSNRTSNCYSCTRERLKLQMR